MENSAITKRIWILAGVIFCILLLSVLCIFIMKKQAKSYDTYAEIYQNDKLIQTVSLANVGEPYEIKIETADGEYNLIEVREGSIGIIEASCPDLLCKHMGFIDSGLMPITCLPNHLVIRVRNAKANDSDGTSIDSLTY